MEDWNGNIQYTARNHEGRSKEEEVLVEDSSILTTRICCLLLLISSFLARYSLFVFCTPLHHSIPPLSSRCHGNLQNAVALIGEQIVRLFYLIQGESMRHQWFEVHSFGSNAVYQPFHPRLSTGT